MWAAAGHKVKFVAMTNGDVGHFESAGGPLAKRRKAEVAECAKILGIQTDVLDIHDGELVPVAREPAEGRPADSRLAGRHRDGPSALRLPSRPPLYRGPAERHRGGRRRAVLRAGYAADDTQPGLHELLGRFPGPEAVHADDRRRDRCAGRQEVEVHPGDALAVRRQGLLAGAHAAQRAAGRSGARSPTCSTSSRSGTSRSPSSTASG